MHPHTSSFSYRIAAAAARLGVLLTPRGLDDVLTANAVCFLALGFWLPIRHALIERHYFPSPPHFFSAVASSFSHTLATVPHRAGLPSFSLTRASSRRTSLQLLVAQAMRITVSLIAPRSFPGRVPGEGFEPQTAAWSSSRWRELRASPTDSRHISYVQSHSIELNRSDLDFWPAHCGVTSHLWLHGLLTPAISGSTTRSSTLQARPGASLFVDTLIPPMRACALLVERRSASRGQHSSSVVAACRCSFRPHHPHCTQRHRGVGLLIGGLAQR